MTRPLAEVLGEVRGHLVAEESLVRAVASGRQKASQPRWRRVELRYVDLKAGRHLQVTAYDATQAHTSNHAVGADAAQAVDGLLAETFGNWHVETTTQTHQVRVTKRLDAVLSTSDRAQPVGVERGHDREKQRLLPEDDPVFRALGLTDGSGRMKPSRQAKYRQVEDFLQILDSSVSEALGSGRLRRPTAEAPLRVVDLGCGNAYLTFTAHRYLTSERGLPVAMTGVDVREQSRDHNSAVAAGLGLAAGSMEFVAGDIATVALDPAPEVVLALHACDTATDEALARAVGWEASLVLAAPCCHHDVAAQLRKAPTPAPYSSLTRHGILRERFADTLTDGLRSSLMRLEGYRVDVMQFVESQHTPRNTLLRAVRSGGSGRGDGNADVREEYDELVAAWGLRPRLGELLGR
ncbi:SAM-dependent methyltransferase [Nocardioides sp.]|uniref:class I SAM-dependent methyltransferase n=1 Tax=Nocardioides sp. TaxID=35761 RepID=UPI002608A134|nr:SAM-dependent methyltransferase [Nocardioides sp.]